MNSLEIYNLKSNRVHLFDDSERRKSEIVKRANIVLSRMISGRRLSKRQIEILESEVTNMTKKFVSKIDFTKVTVDEATPTINKLVMSVVKYYIPTYGNEE